MPRERERERERDEREREREREREFVPLNVKHILKLDDVL